jgi:hypothetical protein
MAKAVVPMHAFRRKFGELPAADITPRLHELVAEFLHEPALPDKKREPAGVKT